MATAYAAVISLMNILDQIRNHRCLSTSCDNKQIESLGEHLDFLLEFIESYSYLGGASEEVEDLERRIASSAHAAEDVIESHVVDRIQAGFLEESPILLVYLEKIIEEMSFIKEVVAKVKEEKRPHYIQKPTISIPAVLFGNSGSRKSMVVPKDLSDKLVERLLSGSRSREVISIIGMEGLGKTTLARNTYEDTTFKVMYDYRAWANVSKDSNVKETLLQLLSCLGRSTRKLVNLNEDELGVELYKMLSGVRYLIVLDDMRSIEAWDRIKCFFPEDNNRSRIIVTTRSEELASYCSSLHKVLMLGFLTQYESWEVFCRTVFGNHETCPPEFEEIGKKITSHCDGYVLLISVIGALLRKSSGKHDFWEYVEESLGSNRRLDWDKRLDDTLMFCYDVLPTCLKPCFLYMGIFPENYEVRISRVVKLWVAEGFLKPNKGHTLEEVGHNYISDLIDRKLFSVSGIGSNGEPKMCKISDVFRDLCIRILEKEKFVSFVKVVNTPQGINNERRFVLHDFAAEKYENPQIFHTIESTLLSRSLVCEGPTLVSFKSRLLRVLVEVYGDSLYGIFEQVNLRLLVHESLHAPTEWKDQYELPSSISLLWNVQTLIFGKKIEVIVAPSEIWEMQELRHVDFHRICLPNHSPSDDKDDSVLQKLQTLKTVVNLECSEAVSRRLPNVKKLRVFYDDFLGEGPRRYWYSLFTKLESLHCYFLKIPNRDDFLQNLKFPSSLKKLVLQDCELQWSDLSIIGSLPLLEVLKLKCQSVRGQRWETVEGEFLRLKFLEIDSCYLIYWSVDESHFPVLERLVLRRLYRLKEIPSRMRGISTLEVFECNISAAILVTQIMRKRTSVKLEVRVGFREEEEVAEFKKKIESDGIVYTGLQIQEL